MVTQYHFGPFELDTRLVELRQEASTLHLEPKVFELLVFLVENRDRVVLKDDIFAAIWPNVFVSDASLSGAIKQLRRALGDDGLSQSYIRTVREKGFRFVAEVAVKDPSPATPSARPATTLPDEKPGGQPVIAVLPFDLISTEDKHPAIADAVPMEINAALARLKSIRLIARGSAFRFRAKAFEPAELLTSLAATYAVTGHVELIGQKLTIYAEVIDTRRQQILWCDSFSGGIGDIFDIRKRIVEEVANAVDRTVPLNEARNLWHVPSENLDAWGLYHIGLRHLYNFNGADNGKAADYFSRAAKADGSFARAFSGLSYTEVENYNLGFGQETDRHLARALDYAQSAVDMDPGDPFANLVLGRAKWVHQDLGEAIEWVDRSLAINPNSAFAHYNSGKLKTIDCAPGPADQHLVSAIGLSPLDPHMQSMLSGRALAAFVRDDRQQAIHFAERSLRAPNAHLYVCVIGAAIFEAYEDERRRAAALDQTGRLGGSFPKDHFLSLFTLSDPARSKVLLRALNALPI